MKKRLLNLMLALVASVAVYAQAPNSFKYQAVVRDAAGGILANQNVSFKISIFRTSTTGTVVYSETHSVTTNNYGLANLNIGTGSLVSGDFSTIDWGSDLYFIKTELDAAGGSTFSDMGISQLQSVPFALNAKTVSDMELDDLNDVVASGATANQVLSWDGNSWVPITPSPGITYSAGSGILLTGTTFSNTAPDLPVTLSSSGATSISGTYPNFTISSTDNNTTYSAGNGLSLSGTTFSAQNTSSLWNANQLQGRTISSTLPVVNQVLGWNGAQWIPQTVSSPWTVSGSDVYRSTGDVGVGTTNPTARLHVEGTVNGTSNVLGLIDVTSGSGTVTSAAFSGRIVGGSTASNIGVEGISEGTTGVTIGVSGVAENGVAGASVIGTSGRTQSNASGRFNMALFGVANGAGDNVFTSENNGVYATASGNSQTNVGGSFQATGTGGHTNIGVYAWAANNATNHAGYFNGNLTYTGTLSSVSDKRLKTNIAPYDGAIDQLMQLNIYRYNYNATGPYANLTLPEEKQYGFLAQDLETLFPELVLTNRVPNLKHYNAEEETLDITEGGAEYKSVNQVGMVPILTKAIQEQQEMIKKQQLLIEKQQQLIENLDQRIVELEK